ncbi:MAG: hypothetical protein QXN68_06260 [Thermoplasmata archaeon]
MKTKNKTINDEDDSFKTSLLSAKSLYTFDIPISEKDSKLYCHYMVEGDRPFIFLEGYAKHDFSKTKFSAYAKPVSIDFMKEVIDFVKSKGDDVHFNSKYSQTKNVILYYRKSDYIVKCFHLDGYEYINDDETDNIEYVYLYDRECSPKCANKALLQKNKSVVEISNIKLDLLTLSKVFEEIVGDVLNDYASLDFFEETGSYDEDVLKNILMISFFNMTYDFIKTKVDKEKIIEAIDGSNFNPEIEIYDVNLNAYYYEHDQKEELDDDDFIFAFSSDDCDYMRVKIMMKFDYEKQILYIYPYTELYEYLDNSIEERFLSQVGGADFYTHCCFNKAAKIGAYLLFDEDKLMLNISSKCPTAQ